MNAPAPAPLAAAVLAGGLSSRMGRDKAFLPVASQRLIDRQIATLRALEPVELLVSGRAGVAYGVVGAREVWDPLPAQGPLAGLLAVLEATTAPQIVVLAVDMPAVTTSLLARLIRQTRPGIGCVPRVANRWEPLAAVYPRAMLPRIQEFWARGGRAVRQLIDAAVAAGELCPLVITADEAPLFASWNTPADLQLESAAADRSRCVSG